MATVKLTKDNLDEILESAEVVVIDFWAEWCGPCRAFGPIFEEASERYPDVTFAKCDTGDQEDLAAAFNIKAIPTLAVLRDKVMLFFQAGALPASALDELLTKVEGLDMAEVRSELAKENAKAAAEEEQGEGGDS